ncbi:MAG: helix-turn-helix domain-containing protein [Planctomycetota bacterium]|jgi:excisionase family DNA binding protein
MEEDLLSTGQAARLCSVSPEAVHGWIKSGRLRASRTAGGHYRIARSDLDSFQGLTVRRQACWEYHRKGADLLETCRGCIVYRAQALRCWELACVGPAAGHSLRFCETTCEECGYYRFTRGRVAHVLVWSRDRKLIEELRRQSFSTEMKLEFAETEYALSALVDTFRPDFVVLDGEVGASRIREASASLLRDARVRLEGIILATDVEQASEAGTRLLSRIGRPFGLLELSERIEEIRADSAMRA